MLILLAFVITAEPAEPVEKQEQPALQLIADSRTTIDNVSLVEHVGIDHVKVALTFRVATSRAGQNDVVIELHVPSDTAVTAMHLSLAGLESDARLVWSDAARQTYERIVNRDRDPALLEWQATSETHQQLLLRVFPVTDKTSATVRIEFIAPRTLALAGVQPQIGVTSLPRPMLGFGRQLGRKLSLIATDRGAGAPEFTRITTGF